MPNNQETTSHFDLTFWMQELKNARSWDETMQKEWVFNAWTNLDSDQRFVFNKLLTGGFRIGISTALIVQALEKVSGIPKDDIQFRISGNWDPYKTSFHSLILEPNETENPTKPYPFCLAYPLENQEILENIAEWQIEYKWDGIRGQLIKRGDTITLWSRGEEIITPSFPEIVDSLAQINFEGVLDGEIIAWDFEKHQPKPFNDIQKRLGRKSPGKKTITSNPCAFICYDLLEHNTTDLRHQPLSTRRNLLLEIFQQNFPQEQNTSTASKPNKLSEQNTSTASIRRGDSRVYREASAEYTASTASILLSEKLNPQSIHELITLRQKAKKIGGEGLMLKRLDSEYAVGRKRGDWWKWKIEPETADAVLIYAQKGHGKRASRYSDFTFALRKGDELVPFAKAYSGLSNKEIEEINHWIKDNTRERFGPVCSVNAELVFEIAFEGINKSPRHKSGIAVRFPRIVRWRRDKKVADINTVDDLLPS